MGGADGFMYELALQVCPGTNGVYLLLCLAPRSQGVPQCNCAPTTLHWRAKLTRLGLGCAGRVALGFCLRPTLQNARSWIPAWGRNKCRKVGAKWGSHLAGISSLLPWGAEPESVEQLLYGHFSAHTSRQSPPEAAKILCARSLSSSRKDTKIHIYEASAEDDITELQVIEPKEKVVSMSMTSDAIITVDQDGHRYYYSWKKAEKAFNSVPQKRGQSTGAKNASHAVCSQNLMLSSADKDGHERLVYLRRNLMAPSKFEEFYGAIDLGKIFCIKHIPTKRPPYLSDCNELANQQEPPMEYVILADQGTFIFTDYRVKEEMKSYLKSTKKEDADKLKFLFTFGRSNLPGEDGGRFDAAMPAQHQKDLAEQRHEVIAACLTLGCAADSDVSERAKEVFKAYQEDMMPYFDVQNQAFHTIPGSSQQPRAVVEPKLLFSQYYGMVLFVHRLIRPIWGERLWEQGRLSRCFDRANNGGEKLLSYIDQLRQFEAILTDTLNQAKYRGIGDTSDFFIKHMKLARKRPEDIQAMRENIFREAPHAGGQTAAYMTSQYNNYMGANKEPLKHEKAKLEGLRELAKMVAETLGALYVLSKDSALFEDTLKDLDGEASNFFKTKRLCDFFVRDKRDVLKKLILKSLEKIRGGKEYSAHVAGHADEFVRYCPVLHDETEQLLEQARQKLNAAKNSQSSTVLTEAEAAFEQYKRFFEHCAKERKYDYFSGNDTRMIKSIQATCCEFVEAFFASSNKLVKERTGRKSFKFVIELAMHAARTLAERKEAPSYASDKLHDALAACFACVDHVLDAQKGNADYNAIENAIVTQVMQESHMDERNMRFASTIFERLLNEGKDGQLNADPVKSSPCLAPFLVNKASQSGNNTDRYKYQKLLVSYYESQTTPMLREAAEQLRLMAIMPSDTEMVVNQRRSRLSLDVRKQHLDEAITCARGFKEAALIKSLEMDQKVAEIQKPMRDALERRARKAHPSNPDHWGRVQHEYAAQINDLETRLVVSEEVQVLWDIATAFKLHAQLLWIKAVANSNVAHLVITDDDYDQVVKDELILLLDGYEGKSQKRIAAQVQGAHSDVLQSCEYGTITVDIAREVCKNVASLVQKVRQCDKITGETLVTVLESLEALNFASGKKPSPEPDYRLVVKLLLEAGITHQHLYKYGYQEIFRSRQQVNVAHVEGRKQWIHYLFAIHELLVLWRQENQFDDDLYAVIHTDSKGLGKWTRDLQTHFDQDFVYTGDVRLCSKKLEAFAEQFQ